MSDFYTPLPFKVCHRCDDGVKIVQGVRYTCGTCNGTGLIPAWYTIPQWEELTGRKVPDDMPVMYRWMESQVWHCDFLGAMPSREHPEMITIIATEAGRPPKNWRPK